MEVTISMRELLDPRMALLWLMLPPLLFALLPLLLPLLLLQAPQLLGQALLASVRRRL